MNHPFGPRKTNPIYPAVACLPRRSPIRSRAGEAGLKPIYRGGVEAKRRSLRVGFSKSSDRGPNRTSFPRRSPIRNRAGEAGPNPISNAASRAARQRRMPLFQWEFSDGPAKGPAKYRVYGRLSALWMVWRSSCSACGLQYPQSSSRKTEV